MRRGKSWPTGRCSAAGAAAPDQRQWRLTSIRLYHEIIAAAFSSAVERPVDTGRCLAAMPKLFVLRCVQKERSMPEAADAGAPARQFANVLTGFALGGTSLGVTDNLPKPIPTTPTAATPLVAFAPESLSVSGKTVTVSSASQLLAAAKAAKAGDTILLASGNFGDVSLSNVRPAGPITIKSANSDNDAVFRTLNIMNSSNIIIEDIDIKRPLAPGASQDSYAVNVGKASNITFVGIDVSGSMNNDARDDGLGMSLNGSRISVIDSTFTQLRTAVAAAGSDFLFAGNTITQVRQGMTIRSMTRAVIDSNYAADFQADYDKKEHPDVFQVHSGSGANASSELIFSNNVMLPGANGFVGGIYIQSEAYLLGRLDQRHENILIENNYYEGNYRHAITVNNADDVTISNNTVRTGVNEGINPAINIWDVTGALVENNISPMFLENELRPSTGVVYENNIDTWDSKTKKGIDASQLFGSVGEGDLDFSRFNVVTGSAAALAGAGFHAVAEIGNLSGTAAAQIAAWLPSFDQNFAVFA
jgi:hypothetical protein